MSEPTLSNVPLLGAQCVAAGLISQDDLDACLMLQQTVYRGTPIGRIMLLQGHLSQLELARMVVQQQHFRRAFDAAQEKSLAQGGGEARATAAQDTAATVTVPELATLPATEPDSNPLFGATG